MTESALICLIWLLFVAVYDFRQRRVPNWLVLAGAASALAALALGSNPFQSSWQSSLLGAATGFGCLLFVYAFGYMGAGDVKFAAVLGLWVGLAALLPIWIISSLLAAAHGLLWLLLRRWALYPRLAALLFHQPTSVDGTSSKGRTKFIPYAAYLAFASVAWISWGRQNLW
ncbi:prepilin peptidase [Variovorax sp. UC122_21]|uniref:A24 family peptidase n=1 Tax=Variovorax sp. UC122_21 TaxID=3374554 RepID=UPI003757BA0C